MACIRYFRYETIGEAYARKAVLPLRTEDIRIKEITKKEYILRELKSKLEKGLTPSG